MRRENTKYIASSCLLSSSKCITRKLSYHKDDHAMRPILRVPWKFSRVHGYAHSYVILNGILFRSILWMCVQNLKFVALSVP